MAAGDLSVKNDLTVEGDLALTGVLTVADGTLVANLNADKVDGAELSTDGTLGDDSDEALPTEKAVKTYADARKAECVALTGNQTVAGVKTFSSPIVADLTGDVTGDVTGGIVETGAGAATLKCKVIEIGDWNMDATVSLTVPHGLGASYKKIRSTSVIVRDDDDAEYADLLGCVVGDVPQGGVAYLTTEGLYVWRKSGGTFDDTDHNATGYNRGWITIWYEA